MRNKKILIGLVVILSLILIPSCTNDSNNSDNNVSSDSKKTVANHDKSEMDISEYEFFTNDEDKTCEIMIGENEPKHEIMKIPNKYKGYTVATITNEGFKYVEKFNTLIVSDTVKEIGNGAFEGCLDLEVVDMGNSVEKIGSNVFIDCKKLKDISLSNSLKRIPYGAFQGCGIEKITIPDSVEEIDEIAFALCENLKEVHIPEGVKKIATKNGPFDGSSNVTIYAPNGSYAEKYAKSKGIPFVEE